MGLKKIINRKLYNTGTARKVGCWDNSITDRLYRVTETLYQKQRGEFFLHGEGGPGSKYAKSTGEGSWADGEKIIPLSYDAAQAWAEEHLDADTYQAVFGQIEDDARTVRMLISMPASVAERVRREAAQAGMATSTYIVSKL